MRHKFLNSPFSSQTSVQGCAWEDGCKRFTCKLRHPVSGLITTLTARRVGGVMSELASSASPTLSARSSPAAFPTTLSISFPPSLSYTAPFRVSDLCELRPPRACLLLRYSIRTTVRPDWPWRILTEVGVEPCPVKSAAG
jgi:hypothetical protein